MASYPFWTTFFLPVSGNLHLTLPSWETFFVLKLLIFDHFLLNFICKSELDDVFLRQVLHLLLCIIKEKLIKA